MTDVQLVIDPATLRSNGTGPVTGELWLLVNSVPFPARGWTDFVIVILAAWADALLELQRDDQAGAKVHFMEGPYVVDLGRTESGLVELRASERDEEPSLIATLPLSDLAGAVVMAGSALVAACRDSSLWSSDAERLAKSLAELRSVSN